MANVTRTAKGGAGKLEQSRPVQWLGRMGDACYGLVHLVVAWLALQVAFGGSAGQSHQVSQQGAVTEIAAQPFGKILLWVVAIGLVAFGVWQLLAALTSYQWITKEGKRTRKRLGSASRGVAVLVIAGFTLKLLFSDPSSSGNSKQQAETARLMAVPFGRILVGLVAVGIIVAAVVIARRGIAKKFLVDLDLHKLPPSAQTWTKWLGIVGFTAKGVAYTVVGILVGIAAITFDPKKAGGLDKALRTLAAQPFGVVLLTAVALGLAAYGVYCFADARCRKI
jgi:Domain of Unknown Function (DUF1206)